MNKNLKARFILDFYGRRLPVALLGGQRAYKEYPEFSKDTDVYLKLCALEIRFPQNPLAILANEKKRNGMRAWRARQDTGSAKIRYNRDSRLGRVSECQAKLQEVLSPMLSRDGRLTSYATIQQSREVLSNALTAWDSLMLPRTVYIPRLDTPSCPDATYIDCREWFGAWLELLTADLPEAADTKVDALSFYCDWARGIIDRHNKEMGGHAQQGNLLVSPPPVYSTKEDPVQTMPVPVRGLSQEMGTVPDSVIEDTVTTITVETRVSLKHTTEQELMEIAESVKLIDNSAAEITPETNGVLVVKLTVPTYCGYPVSDGNHGIAFHAAVQHIDNLLRLVENARSAQESNDNIEKLSRAYSGR